MGALVDMRFACSMVSLPVCSVLFQGSVHAKFPARAVSFGRVNLYSPYTILFLSMCIVMCVILINRTKKMYSYPARKEMLLFLRTYLATISLDLVLCFGIRGFSLLSRAFYAVVVSLQLGCLAASFVAAFGTGYVWMFPKKLSSECANMCRRNTLFALCFLTGILLVCNLTSLGVGVFAIIFLLPAIMSFLFSFSQLAKLGALKVEIWNYGSILVVNMFMLLIGSTPLGLGALVVLISDRYIDGIFFMHLLGFLTVLKVYNLWCLDKEQEIECVNTVKQGGK
ncbi:hypothetical protein NEHOM01_0718 [Nematocida homosporus]|uniref:uncharacterized protein n=1 Tax=Nematocida homosporus TaxID=1912981 RepID=UPI0022205195|nr:uncharacterized protein NEHOM01_0718 [Nematocida homosporus]KAI5185260.1 hypothetical protein NEHOM01_0718 [Nematocida homosporus]